VIKITQQFCKRLILYRKDRKPDVVLGVIVEKKEAYFKFRTGSGRFYSISFENTPFSLENTNIPFKDFSNPEKIPKGDL
jgi:hypothetical protein